MAVSAETLVGLGGGSSASPDRPDLGESFARRIGEFRSSGEAKMQQVHHMNTAQRLDLLESRLKHCFSA